MDKFELPYRSTGVFDPKTALWDLLCVLDFLMSSLYRAGLLIWLFAGSWCIMHILPIEFNFLVLFNFFSLVLLGYDIFLGDSCISAFIFFFWLICAVKLNYCLIMISVYYHYAGVLTFLV